MWGGKPPTAGRPMAAALHLLGPGGSALRRWRMGRWRFNFRMRLPLKYSVPGAMAGEGFLEQPHAQEAPSVDIQPAARLRSAHRGGASYSPSLENQESAPAGPPILPAALFGDSLMFPSGCFPRPCIGPTPPAPPHNWIVTRWLCALYLMYYMLCMPCS